jgi:hypothetical protein
MQLPHNNLAHIAETDSTAGEITHGIGERGWRTLQIS